MKVKKIEIKSKKKEKMFGEEYALRMHIEYFWELRKRLLWRGLIVLFLWSLILLLWIWHFMRNNHLLSIFQIMIHFLFFVFLGPVYLGVHVAETRMRMIAYLVTSHQRWIISGSSNRDQVPDMLIKFAIALPPEDMQRETSIYKNTSEWVTLNNTSVFQTFFLIFIIEWIRFIVFTPFDFLLSFPLFAGYYFFSCYFCFALNGLSLVAFDQKNTIPMTLLDDFV